MIIILPDEYETIICPFCNKNICYEHDIDKALKNYLYIVCPNCNNFINTNIDEE